MGELVDPPDLKSCGPHGPCEFESHLRYKNYFFMKYLFLLLLLFLSACTTKTDDVLGIVKEKNYVPQKTTVNNFEIRDNNARVSTQTWPERYEVFFQLLDGSVVEYQDRDTYVLFEKGDTVILTLRTICTKKGKCIARGVIKVKKKI